MAETVTINLRHVARGLGIPLHQVQVVVELLDDGNTVPFITRYRKDQTGGLDEEQIRQVQARLTKMRLLTDRKQTILRSIESQGKLTEELSKQIRAAGTTKRLEDLYLPYKPKKQTLATAARSRGLEPLAMEILRADPVCVDLDTRAADYVDPDRQVPTPAEALLGAGHILAELFSERAETRQQLREILERTGRLRCTRIGAEPKADVSPGSKAGPTPKAEPGPKKPPNAEVEAKSKPPRAKPGPDDTETPAEGTATGPPATQSPPEVLAEPPRTAPPQSAAEEPEVESAIESPKEPETEPVIDSPKEPEAESAIEPPKEPEVDLPMDAQPADGGEQPLPEATQDSDGEESKGSGQGGGETKPDATEPAAEPPSTANAEEGPGKEDETQAADKAAAAPAEPAAAVREEAPPAAETPTEPVPEQKHEEASPAAEAMEPPRGGESSAEVAATATPAETEVPAEVVATEAPAVPPAAVPEQKAAARRPKKPAKPRPSKTDSRRRQKEQKKKRDKERQQRAFSDYFDYTEQITKIPPHRVLAINRGERAKVLRVKIEIDVEAMHGALDEACVPADHPHAEFMRGCARDALTRLVLPSLERDVRREQTDRAEAHAVGVFAKNLRNLLLQPPVHGRRVLAVDPGYKSGCKLVALDQFGNVLAHDLVYLVGRPERRQQARQKAIDLVNRFQLTAITIGNGTACRDAENFFAALVAEELRDRGVRYTIVNEAGASVYSTSHVGREEFPDYDASLRGAISIGRRLQDPLSELVKIDPANIGVGLYQHDVRAKHLRDSLEGVVESCVNYVGVDVNTASPSLLRRVSGLNQLTARRVYEHRMRHGPFRNRQQLREVPGFGEATFVQAAGFCKISTGDDPLDATWIHPESYPIATRVLEKFDCSPEDLRRQETAEKLTERIAQANVAELSKELDAGELLIRDILAQLARPGRDPREDLPAPVFKQGIVKLENLTPGMELTGTVLNVVDFGAFVDIGMHDSGLVHVSQLADKYIRDPHEVVVVGNVVKVWVVKVDKDRRRVSLTMIPPGAKQRESAPRGKPGERARPRGPQRPSGDRKPRPRGGGPPHGKRRSEARPTYRPKPKPKPLKPLSEEMKRGAEPMRTFGDLLQFYESKDKPPKDDAAKKGGGKNDSDGKNKDKTDPDKPQDPQP